ncbi:MAG: hypothetical protein IKJ82_03910 [Oscillospiraceae bacterium]|nr:hypothetical protein [Oscillospiraceae bacterium]
MGRNSSFNPETSKRRVFFIELYPDSESYNCEELLSVARSFPEYALILHDKDVNINTGELKKPHYHVCIRVKPALLSTIANKFPGLDTRFIEVSHEFRWCLRYLVHLDDLSKFQYPHEAVETNIADIESYWRTSSEWSLVNEMIILRSNGASWKEVFCFAGKNQCYDVFRRNYAIISMISNEMYENRMVEVNEPWDESL